MTVIKNQQTQGNYNKKMSIAYINLLSFGAFFIIVASIVARQLFLQEIWKYIDLNGGVTRWQIITIVSRVKLNRVLYMRATSCDFSLFHARSLSEGSNKSAHLAVSLEPLPTGKSGFVYPWYR